MLKQILLPLCLISLLLAGCSSLDQAGCLNADWRTLGFEDGIKGRNESQISNYRQDCAKHGVTPDLAAYRAGHYEGSAQFCTAKNGFAQGRNNHRYQNSCPPEFASAFMAGYRDGQTLYQAKTQLDGAHNELRDIQQEIYELESSIAKLNEQLVADGLTREQRITIRDELAKLNESLGQANLVRDELAAAIIVYQNEFSRLQQHFSY
ncbi:hypothetical protein AGRI_09876 [Alishewanella agri BL06]|uniref:DUF2799 domain-containing protein n=1 Tax=Alishewanella agri BL06 TaxID=1195246 RepID=I8U941_9ALTE|nr:MULTISPECIES: DUF2799 domain-containing protein [Alishewanella]EIW88513.1 hypothetical protein AGRI_09876 [Alishewanella agri BL06]KRS21229.1 hypothetical protein AAY72_09075 [Alishewanella sp. WH16-1]